MNDRFQLAEVNQPYVLLWMLLKVIVEVVFHFYVTSGIKWDCRNNDSFKQVSQIKLINLTTKQIPPQTHELFGWARSCLWELKQTEQYFACTTVCNPLFLYCFVQYNLHGNAWAQPGVWRGIMGGELCWIGEEVQAGQWGDQSFPHHIHGEMWTLLQTITPHQVWHRYTTA